MRYGRWTVHAAPCLFALILSTSVVRAQAFNFHDHYRWNPENEHVYRLTPTADTWQNCQDYAVNHMIGTARVAGNLATVRSGSENQWLFETYFPQTTGAFWMGFNDIAAEGNWVWVSGEPVTYTHWRSGEPNNQNNEDAVTMTGQTDWNDSVCNSMVPGVVEIVPPSAGGFGDFNGNGVPDAFEDWDGDGTPGAFEDRDGDGTPDAFEDWNGDGTPDAFEDRDGSGTPDAFEDRDGNGGPDAFEDWNGNGTADAFEDWDGDGFPDAFEDSNTNGLFDGFEDWDGNGTINLVDEWANWFGIDSPTHPSPYRWFNSSGLAVSWSDDRASSATGWVWLVDGGLRTTATLVNGVVLPLSTTSTLVTGLAPGTHYFHLVSLDQNGSPTSGSQQNRRFNINVNPPRVTCSTHPDPFGFASPTTATFTLDYPEGTNAASFSYLYALTPKGEHDFAVDGYTTASLGDVSVGGLAAGRHYFHATTVDTVGTTCSATATFPILIGESGVAIAGDVTTDTATDRSLDVALWAKEPNDTVAPMADAWRASDWPTGRKITLEDVALENETTRTLSWDTSRIDDGTYEVAATYRDSNGTTQTAEAPGRVMIQRWPLSVSSSSHPDPSRWYPKTVFTMTWSRPQDCEPYAIGGYRYAVDQSPETTPDTSSTFATSTLHGVTLTIGPMDYGRNYFHLRWIDRFGNLSQRTTHFPFHAIGSHLNNYEDLPWFDPFTSFDTTLWYRSSSSDVTVGSEKLTLKNRGNFESISQQFNHTEPHVGPYQVDLNKVTLGSSSRFLVIATRSDNAPRYTAPTNDDQARTVNNGIEVYLRENRIEVYLRRRSGTTTDDQLLGAIDQSGVMSGTRNVCVLDTGGRVYVFVDNDANPKLEVVSNHYPGGGFFFMGGRYNAASEEVTIDDVHIFRPTRPEVHNVGIRGEPDLLHISTREPVFQWEFRDDDDYQYLCQVQVQRGDREWTQPPVWQWGPSSTHVRRVITYGESGGSPTAAPTLQEGVRYKFRVRVQDRTLWSHTWVGDDYQEYEFEINETPDIAHLAIVPGNPTATDDLVATATVSDTFGENVALSWAWYRDGALVSDLTGNRVEANRTASGQSWRVRVTPDDGHATGEAREASVLVSGAPSAGRPSVDDISLDGNSASAPSQIDALWHLTNASPTIAWNYTDPDGDPQGAYEVEVRDGPAGGGALVWGSGEVSGSASSVACGVGLSAGATCHVRVRVSDSAAWSEWRETPCRMNSIPTVPLVKIEPGPVVGEPDELHGVAMATDADGDAVTYEYEWQRNGASTGHDTRTLPAGTLTAGESWSLKARASDGIAWSDWAESAAVTVDASVAHHASIEYDANGSMTRNGDRTFEYDTENRLRKVRHAGAKIAEYWYNQTGQRVRKAENGTSTFYVGKHYEIAGATGDQPTSVTKYYYAGNRRIAEVDPHNEVFFYHLDHLGGTHVVTDSAGTSVTVSEHYPYGAQRQIASTRDLTKRFTGKEQDATGLYYYGARYYNPQTMTCTTADPVIPGPSNPQALNRYAYVLNNPTNRIDPTGHWSFKSIGRSIRRAVKKVVKTVRRVASAVKSAAKSATNAVTSTVKRAVSSVRRGVGSSGGSRGGGGGSSTGGDQATQENGSVSGFLLEQARENPLHLLTDRVFSRERGWESTYSGGIDAAGTGLSLSLSEDFTQGTMTASYSGIGFSLTADQGKVKKFGLSFGGGLSLGLTVVGLSGAVEFDVEELQMYNSIGVGVLGRKYTHSETWLETAMRSAGTLLAPLLM